MKESIFSGLIAATCIVGLVVGIIYINKHVDCWDFFGLYKGCGITTIK